MSSSRYASKPLSLATKLFYGLGDWGASASTTSRNIYWQFFFLSSVVGLSPATAGTILLIGTIWDGVNDPLIGMLSDRIHTRWGRRRPFLLVGAIPFGLGFLLMFLVPPFRSTQALAIYYTFAVIFHDTFYTAVNVPYAALTPELTSDYDERSSLAGWRIGVSILAALITAFAFRLLAEEVFAPWAESTFGVDNPLQVGFAIVAGIWGLTMAIPPIILFFKIEEPELAAHDGSKFQPIKTFREVYSNIPFRWAAIVYTLTFASVDVLISVFVWFLLFYVKVAPGTDSMVMGVVLGIAFLSMPLTVKLMHRFGKRRSYIGSMTLMAITLVIVSQVPPGGVTMVFIAAIFAGLGYGAASVIPWSMVADVVESDELISGQRREGMYAGYLVFFRKIASALALWTVGMILSRVGFISGTTGSAFVQQPESALLALRMIIGYLPGIMLVLAILAAWRYPLTKEKHREIVRELAARKEAAKQTISLDQ